MMFVRKEEHSLTSVWLVLVPGPPVLGVLSVTKETPALAGRPTVSRQLKRGAVVTMAAQGAPASPAAGRGEGGGAVPKMECPGEVPRDPCKWS